MLERTAQPGDVMKESMSVAKTVAWTLMNSETKNKLHKESKKCPFGLHIHCPDGATPKDGPSAGTAITVSIISTLLRVPVLNTVAITGEIDLNGMVGQIGGLDTKIRGAKKAGVKHVLYPSTNANDILLMTKDSKSSPFNDDFKGTPVSTIFDVIPIVFPNLQYQFRNYTSMDSGSPHTPPPTLVTPQQHNYNYI